MRDKIVLSDRLQAIVSMVTPGNRVCDIGCDHGFVPVYLVRQGISPGAIAMDVRKGPLSQADLHIRTYGLEALIQTRLSDGLAAFRAGEADTLICAGMGGRLMMRILTEEAEKAASFRELILQPQSEIQMFRAFLRVQGYLITPVTKIFRRRWKTDTGRCCCGGNIRFCIGIWSGKCVFVIRYWNRCGRREPKNWKKAAARKKSTDKSRTVYRS